MSYQMNIDEILEALGRANHPAAQSYQAALEGVATAMAIALAQSQRVVAGVGMFEGLGFAGLCVPFFPAFEGQALPECMDGYDEAKEWAYDADFVPRAGLSFQPESSEFTCRACGREELQCSNAPCPAVIADRES